MIKVLSIAFLVMIFSHPYHALPSDLEGRYQSLLESVFHARGLEAPQPPKPPRPTLQSCQEDFFSGETCTDSELPYSAVSSQSISQLPKPNRFDIADFTVIGAEARFQFVHVRAVDSAGVVTPSIEGISEGQVLERGQQIDFVLSSPPTDGRQASLSFGFSLTGLDGITCEQRDFSYTVTFTSN